MKSSIGVELLSIGQQNDHFQEITCIRFQRSSTVQYDCIKYYGFKGNYRFGDLHEIYAF